jgi:hypothetical protein
MIKMNPPSPAPRRKRGAQPGNLNALKHGFYSRHLRPQESADLEQLASPHDLQSEVALLRVMMRRLQAAADDLEDIRDFVRVLHSLSACAVRIAVLLRTQQSLDSGSTGEAESEFAAALREVRRDLKAARENIRRRPPAARSPSP